MGTLTRKSNMQALKAAYDKAKQGGDFKFWKPIKYGKYLVRFLPPKDSNGVFFKETAQHRVGDNYYFCPKAEGEACPICEKYKKLYDIGTDAAIALAKEIKPRKQYLYNIIVKEELEKESDDPLKVHAYMSGKILYDTLMDYFFDEEYGDLTDVESGYDFIINKQKGELDFPTYKNSKPKKMPSPLGTNEEIEEILDNLKDLNKEIDVKTYDELAAALNSYLSNEKAEGSTFVDNSSSTANISTKSSDDSDDEALDDYEKNLLAKLEEDDDE
jgi:hypothetical protein